ncbi:MAG TPA: hypothetical protein VLZ12_03565 [Verrucomicrobiae bacterium]|nr:hypothetical protein [Verrucomicrobiae bacterium]
MAGIVARAGQAVTRALAGDGGAVKGRVKGREVATGSTIQICQ